MEESIHGDLPNLEDTSVQTLTQTLLTDTSMTSPSEVCIVTHISPGTISLDHNTLKYETDARQME